MVFKEDIESEYSDLFAEDWEKILAGSTVKKFGRVIHFIDRLRRVFISFSQ